MGGVEARDPILRFGPKNPLARIAETRRVEHIADFRTEPAYLEREPRPVAPAAAANAPTHFIGPIVKEEKLTGVSALSPQDVAPSTAKPISLAPTFPTHASLP